MQLAQLVFLVLAALILQELAVGEQFQLAGRCRTWRGSKRGCSCGGQRAERAFPKTTVA